MMWSIVALLALLAAAFLAVSLLARVKSRAFHWWVALVLCCAAIAGFLFVDVNVPLSESHLYPDSAPAPLWLALLATFARFAAFASLIVMRDVLRPPAGEPGSERKADA